MQTAAEILKNWEGGDAALTLPLPVKIKTTHVYPPIPIRSMDWCATTDDYDCDCDQDGFFSTHPIGWGATEAEAIADLKSQLEA